MRWVPLLFVVGRICFPFTAICQGIHDSRLFSVLDLEKVSSTTNQIPGSFRVGGVVRAVVPKRGLLALQDESGTALFELSQISSAVNVGEQIIIESSRCLLTRTRFGFQIGDVPAVDNDGLHPEREKSGSIFLNAGMTPIRLEWFNGPTDFSLDLEYEGPGIQRQKVPNNILWRPQHAEHGQQDLCQGLDYQAYEGVGWQELPNFSLLNPTATGVATNISTSYRSRDENCGLLFNGLLQIDHPGSYTFFLKSDDGSRLYTGESSIAYTVIKSTATLRGKPESLEEALTDRHCNHWVQMAGEVTFASEDQQSLVLEMLVGGSRVPVEVIGGKELVATSMLHHSIQVEGVCTFSSNAEDKRLVGVFVPGPELVKFGEGDARSGSSKSLLTTAAQVRRLTSAEAEKHIPVQIRGVVIYASSTAAVLQDSSGGLFISFRDGVWKKPPGLGELWEMEGTTDSGFFSPVITADKATFLDYASLPEPIQPTRDQLMNGNIDAEYGELHGVITSVSSNEIGLLTADGKVSVMGSPERRLPTLSKTLSATDSLIGSVVRIRGCFAPLVDLQTRQVVSGKTFICPALVEVEDPASKDPFQLPARTPSDLMWFNARAMALQRTKLTGQVLYSLPGEYFVLDDKKSFRVMTHDSSVKVGDLIEAVGFPKLDGPSPILLEAQIRKIGHALLPNPSPISPEHLLDREFDSKLIEIEAVLISDTIHQGERALELQSGLQHFMARFASVPGKFAPLPAGCRLRLTGVYTSAYGDQGHAATNIAPFELLLNTPADIIILQRPPWWTLQRIVILLVALCGLLSVTFIWVALLRRKVEQRTTELKKEIEQRRLVEQDHAIELERTRVARDLHDELGAGLTEVGLLGSLANTPAIEPEEKNHYLNQITQMARSLVTSLDEIVWAVNPHYDSLTSLVSYFSLHADTLLNLAGIACRLQVAEHIPQCPLDSKQRHGVFCAFKEALTNVIRHSGATEVKIAFEVAEGKLLLSVIDNGCGFKFVDDEPGKDGLASICQRMKELGGMCQVDSHPGHGTTVQISLPLNQD